MNDLEKRLAALQIDLDNTWQKLQINQKIENLKELTPEIESGIKELISETLKESGFVSQE